MAGNLTGDIYWPVVCDCGNSSHVFWSERITWNTDNPDLTSCFQRTCLSWTPCAVLWLCLPFYLIYMSREQTIYSWAQKSRLNIAKFIISVLLLVVSIVELLKTVQEDYSGQCIPLYLYLDPAVKCATFALTTYLIHREFCLGFVTSGVLFVFWLLSALLGIVPFRSLILNNGYEKDVFRFVTFFVYYGLVLVELGLHLVADVRNEGAEQGHVTTERTPLLSEQPTAQQPQDEHPKLAPCPERTAPFLARITHHWLTSLIFTGYKKTLVFKNMYELLDDLKSENLVPKFQEEWTKQCKKMTKPKNPDETPKPNPSLIFCLLKISFWPFISAGFLRAILIGAQFLNPVILQLVIAYVQGGREQYQWRGYMLAVLLLFINVLTSLISHTQQKFIGRAAMRIRTVMTCAIYRKSLRFSNTSRRETTVGAIVNLMSIDAQRLHDFTVGIHELWAAPVVMVVAMVYLWNVIGPSSLAGIGILLILAPINGGVLIRQYTIQQRANMKHKDSRIKMLNQIFNGMKVLKMYAWEPSLSKMVNDIREKELSCIRKMAYVMVAIGVTFFCAPYLMSLFVFMIYVLSSPDHYLDPQKAFVSISLIQIFQMATTLLPMFLAFGAGAFVSMNRIKKALLEDELDESAISHDLTADSVVKISNATFSWTGEETKPVLSNINVDVFDGDLVAVVGQVGSGKSSLIQSMLGELNKQQGTINIKGTVAYVPQQAWIQNASLRNNVLFGKKYNEYHYDNIIDACALKPDFDILPAGDSTEIGEKGINLSGGQKQRVSLARAVYQSEDIYLLDDPLSAVDAHVGKHIFDKVIGPDGLLARKTRILVTHGVTYLHKMDKIIVIKDGGISETGSYQDLLDNDGAFSEFIRTYLETGDAEKLDDEELEVLEALQRQLSTRSGTSDGEDGMKSPESGKEQQPSSPSKRKSVSPTIRSASRGKSASPAHGDSIKKEKDEKSSKKKAELIEEETAEVGAVRWSVLKDYILQGGLVYIVKLLIFELILMASAVGANVWLSEWSDDVPKNGSEGQAQTNLRLGVYGAFGAGQMIGILGQSLSVFLGGLVASSALHNRLLNRMLRAPVAFFDTTPIGRIVNRFSTDMEKIDTTIPMYSRFWMMSLSSVVATIAVITYVTPIFLAVAIPLAILYIIVQRVYIRSLRQIKRIDSIRKSPIYANFDETLVGVSCVRAFRQEHRFVVHNDNLVDDSQKTWYLILIAQRWLGFNLETMGAVIVFFATLFAIMDTGITPGMAGLSVSFAMQTTNAINMLVRGATDLETHVVSIERIKEYSEVETEAPWEVEGNRPPDSWPEKGEIDFKDYSVRYRPGLELVLKDISFSIKSGENVGIVGRTGAGKSSMTLSLFRIIEAAGGSISVDGIRIDKIGLHDLRSKFTIIPQDPVLFSGSLRLNLDPFNQHEDSDLWVALEHAHLKEFVSGLEEGMQYECGEGGESLSVGQRQLVCLARALLRKSRILILDEATAAVDLETDDLIQNTIRTKFRDCTIVTIAHRLNTIMDYDRVMVLDKGRIKEFDNPTVLLKDEQTLFYGMAKDAGIVNGQS